MIAYTHKIKFRLTDIAYDIRNNTPDTEIHRSELRYKVSDVFYNILDCLF